MPEDKMTCPCGKVHGPQKPKDPFASISGQVHIHPRPGWGERNPADEAAAERQRQQASLYAQTPHIVPGEQWREVLLERHR